MPPCWMSWGRSIGRWPRPVSGSTSGRPALLPEQVKVLNRLLDGGERGFEHGISASQYQKVAKVSKATATRHLAGLVEKGCLVKLPGGGRSTRYQVPERFHQDSGE